MAILTLFNGSITYYSSPSSATVYNNNNNSFNFTLSQIDPYSAILNPDNWTVQYWDLTSAVWNVVGNYGCPSGYARLLFTDQPSGDSVVSPLILNGNFSVTVPFSSGQLNYLASSLGSTKAATLVLFFPQVIPLSSSTISSFTITAEYEVYAAEKTSSNSRIFISKIVIPSIKIRAG